MPKQLIEHPIISRHTGIDYLATFFLKAQTGLVMLRVLLFTSQRAIIRDFQMLVFVSRQLTVWKIGLFAGPYSYGYRITIRADARAMILGIPCIIGTYSVLPQYLISALQRQGTTPASYDKHHLHIAVVYLPNTHAILSHQLLRLTGINLSVHFIKNLQKSAFTVRVNIGCRLVTAMSNLLAVTYAGKLGMGRKINCACQKLSKSVLYVLCSYLRHAYAALFREKKQHSHHHHYQQPIRESGSLNA